MNSVLKILRFWKVLLDFFFVDDNPFHTFVWANDIIFMPRVNNENYKSSLSMVAVHEHVLTSNSLVFMCNIEKLGMGLGTRLD